MAQTHDHGRSGQFGDPQVRTNYTVGVKRRTPRTRGWTIGHKHLNFKIYHYSIAAGASPMTLASRK